MPNCYRYLHRKYNDFSHGRQNSLLISAKTYCTIRVTAGDCARDRLFILNFLSFFYSKECHT